MKQKKRKKKQKDNRAAMEDTVSRENEAQGETGGKLDPIPVELIIKDPTPGRLRQHGWTGMLGLPLHGLDFLVDTELVFLLGNPDVTSEIYLYGYKKHQQLVYREIEYPWCMMLCPGNRQFDMTGIREGQTVMKFRRPFRWESGCCGCCCCCCLQEMIVEAPEGQVVGYVQEDCSAVGAVFSILDANGVPVFKVQGLCTCCISPCCPEGSYFVIYVPDTVQILGWIHFGNCPIKQSRMQVVLMKYPKDLDVGMKATVIACAMLIKYIFYDEMSIHYWLACVGICLGTCGVIARNH
ncbi:phospholipid scramblase 2-like isoform X2 [Ornithodoros turicata]|uniref:phospholipid scramblase 2-like isoform X2 n=1 Tax=Ornithodoros turicata TaxID=34597 RepID=UPI0031388B4A